MPRIRKKTSKRISTHQRAKFKHKVAEGRKKKKKEAKKHPQWKSKKRKDPGIPNNFPYKDQILAEVAEARKQAEEAKQRRKEEKKVAREDLLVKEAEIDVCPDDDPSGNSSSSGAQTKNEAPLLLNPDLPDLKAVLEKADVVLHVLDARDPASYRLPHIEELALVSEKTEVVFVFSKIDLVPREALIAWMKHLRTQHSTFLFRSASCFLPKTQLNDPKVKGKTKESTDDAVGADALLEYLCQCAGRVQSETLQVAVVGLTNSGKSAIVNSLARKSVVPVYSLTSSTDARRTTTTRAFEVPVEVVGHKISLVDTPGVSFEVEQDDDEENLKTRDMLLRSRGRVDKVKDPVPALEYIVSRADTQDLMVHYNLPAFIPGDCSAFLAGIARSAGLLKKRGEADLTQAARTVLKDWTTGKLPFYTDAPKEDNATDLMNAGTDLASLGELYVRADEVALTSVRTRREMRKLGGLVRIIRGEAERRRVALDAQFVVEEGESESESGQGRVKEGNDQDDGNNEDDGNDEEEDEEADEEEGGDDNLEGGEDREDEEVDLLTPPLTGKRKRKAKAAATSAAPPRKKVTFAAETQDRKARQQMQSGYQLATKATSKPVSKISKHPPGRALPTKAITTKAKTSMSKATDAYDFDQFFKS